MYESCKEYYCKGCTVVFDENSYVVLEKGASAYDSTHVANDKDEESDHDGEVERFLGSLAGQNLDAFLKVDKSYVEPEDIARETSDVFEGITRVSDSKSPMHNHGPSRNGLVKICYKMKGFLQSNQRHKREIIGASGRDDIVNGTAPLSA